MSTNTTNAKLGNNKPFGSAKKAFIGLSKMAISSAFIIARHGDRLQVIAECSDRELMLFFLSIANNEAYHPYIKSAAKLIDRKSLDS